MAILLFTLLICVYFGLTAKKVFTATKNDFKQLKNFK